MNLKGVLGNINDSDVNIKIAPFVPAGLPPAGIYNKKTPPPESGRATLQPVWQLTLPKCV